MTYQEAMEKAFRPVLRQRVEKKSTKKIARFKSDRYAKIDVSTRSTLK